MYYDLEGNPIEFEQWAAIREVPYRSVVKQDTINHKFISTVWLGVNHNFGEGKPLIFETMIFPEEGKDKWQEEYCERYSTMEEAIQGHKRAVALVEGEQK